MASNGQSDMAAAPTGEVQPLIPENFVAGMKRPGGPQGAGGKKKKTADLDFSKNAVQLLNELRMGLEYTVTDQAGPVHQPNFTMQVVVDGNAYTGVGNNKKIAKLACAQAALAGLGHIGPAGAGNGTVNAEGAAVAPTGVAPTGDARRSPMVILNEIRPGLQYQTVSEVGEVQNKVFTMAVTVSNETFQGSGNSKRQAKAFAAQDALQKMYNLQFSTTTGGDPTFIGKEDDYAIYKPGNISQQYAASFEGGKNPVQELNELYTGLPYNFETHEDKSMTCAIEIENQRFEALGLNKKAVKLQVAVEAIRWLHESGLYAQRSSEIMARRAQRKGNNRQYAQNKNAQNMQMGDPNVM